MVFACCSLKIANVVLHVLKLSVKLFNCFGILPFLVLNLVCVRLNEPFEQLHQIVDVLSFILLLNCGVNHTHELRYRFLVSSCFALLMQQLFLQSSESLFALLDIFMQCILLQGLELVHFLHIE